MRRLTQLECATRSGISLDTMASIEQCRRLPSDYVLGQIARVLRVDKEALVGTHMETERAGGHAAIPMIHSALLGMTEPSQPMDLSLVEARVAELVQAWFGRRSYDETAALIPDLIRDLEQLERAHRTPQERSQRAPLARLSFQTYYIAGQFARMVLARDVAVGARQRMLLAAEAADDPAVIAVARWAVALQLSSEGNLDISQEIIMRQLEELRHTAGDSLVQQSLLGMSVAAASIIAGRQGDLNGAMAHAEEARRIASSTGEHSIYQSAWGPTNVAIHMTEIAATHGVTTEGLRAADLIAPGSLEALPTVERRFHFLVTMAWLYDQLGQDQGVMLYLRHAIHVAPDEARHSGLVHQLIRGLLHRTRTAYKADVMALAQQLGTLPSAAE